MNLYRLASLVVVVLGAVGPARADLITFSVGGASFNGDTVTLEAGTFTHNLTAGTPLIAELQYGLFTPQTALGAYLDSGVLSRSITAGFGSATVSQNVSDLNDGSGTNYLVTIDDSSTVTISVGGGRLLDITPISTAYYSPQGEPQTLILEATFLLRADPAAVPEPATTVLAGLGVVGAGAVVRRFRKSA